MEISCDIIRDILPLYAEDMVSPATRELVDNHLCGCDDCTKELAALKKAAEVPVDTQLHSLERVSNTIRRRKRLTVLCAIATVVSLVWSSMVFLCMPVYLSAEQAIEGVELQEDGAVAIDYTHYNGLASYQSGENAYVFCVHTSRYDWLRNKYDDRKMAGMTEAELKTHIQEKYDVSEVTQVQWDRFRNIQRLYCARNDQGDMNLITCAAGELPANTLDYLHTRSGQADGTYQLSQPEFDLWYLEENGDTNLLWNGGDGKNVTVPYPDHLAKQYRMLFYVSLAVLVLAVVAAGCLKGRWKEAAAWLGIGAGSIAATFLLVTGGDMVDLMGARAVHWSQHYVPTTVLLAVTALLWRRLYLMDKKGQGL